MQWLWQTLAPEAPSAQQHAGRGGKPGQLPFIYLTEGIMLPDPWTSLAKASWLCLANYAVPTECYLDHHQGLQNTHKPPELHVLLQNLLHYAVDRRHVLMLTWPVPDKPHKLDEPISLSSIITRASPRSEKLADMDKILTQSIIDDIVRCMSMKAEAATIVDSIHWHALIQALWLHQHLLTLIQRFRPTKFVVVTETDRDLLVDSHTEEKKYEVRLLDETQYGHGWDSKDVVHFEDVIFQTVIRKWWTQCGTESTFSKIKLASEIGEYKAAYTSIQKLLAKKAGRQTENVSHSAFLPQLHPSIIIAILVTRRRSLFPKESIAELQRALRDAHPFDTPPDMRPIDHQQSSDHTSRQDLPELMIQDLRQLAHNGRMPSSQHK